MAQLSDDCFAFGRPMMTVAETVALITSRVLPLAETESIPLCDADRRILARDLIASIALPPYANSAVDGYAMRGVDLPATGERGFQVSGRIQAGSGARVTVAPGEAVRIFTGAPMPAGADTVFMQEDVRLGDSGEVTLPAGLTIGANMRPVGEDVEAGAVVLKAGRRLRPQDIALAAALGEIRVDVSRRVRVAVFSTGNEIVAAGTPRGPTQLFDSNRFMLMAMLGRLGCAITDLGILPDDRAAITDTLRKASSAHDLILTSGGVSTGEADFVKDAVESAGSLVFWRVAIKPGRPVAMGVIDGTPFIGLPGNPVASFVTFAYIARPAILALSGAGRKPIVSTPVRTAFSYKKKKDRREYVRVNLRPAANGSVEAVKFPREGAGLLSSLVETDGLIELAEDVTQIQQGDIVGFIPYSSLY
ncbi:gephyrin-like molybdotransferase Glp [Aurantimonas sp. C2-6-R+9]|uniref:molybdopterin molybdotransferase MoeA n=1 Tax=unclassified Aurantimonas TaxID=2638230 RepID=UPI002E17F2DC|nr:MULTISPECIES: gephyrin-like molybdotransferase Glp [unclassified Aurantimonas]MEC5289484.1 gephyrin-like molybdotransferase Glp [Aurantimonas sp. C2-3-R2]MEC5380841.1 gephyrin-like molybdotransferase Glp [Aurantimonas sp. C2-6-R+9]MEC5410565.1 gephyrin-like molybdotransferase Glp [Aurantimonas sp. C2-4-R8]